MKNTEPGKKICDHCHRDPGKQQESETVWNGFYDKDTDQLVCWSCRNIHYHKKWKTEFKGLYTEFPVIINKALKVFIRTNEEKKGKKK